MTRQFSETHCISLLVIVWGATETLERPTRACKPLYNGYATVQWSRLHFYGWIYATNSVKVTASIFGCLYEFCIHGVAAYSMSHMNHMDGGFLGTYGIEMGFLDKPTAASRR
ncbi:hypothetical protein HDV63DRAFT_111266 [Trichoderma sp. SZMC 28014]